MSEISDIHAREILDSRGNPAVEVEVFLKSGVCGTAAVPSGASTGEREALELRDGDLQRFNGKGCLQAVRNVKEKILPELEGMDVRDQLGIDQAMIDLDGTPDKSRLGANAILGVSMAVARAAAAELDLPLFRYLGGVGARVMPIPMMNLLNGGSHSDAPVAFQEFLIRPVGARSFPEALEMGQRVFLSLKQLLKSKRFPVEVGDEGGFAPRFTGGAAEALGLLCDAVARAGFTPGGEITLALDCAASACWDNGIYDYPRFEGENAPRLNREEQLELLTSLAGKYPIDSIEDGMAENDWEGWQLLTRRLGEKIQLVGDDLFVTNERYLEKGIQLGAANAILIKPNQIGTLSETLETIQTARRAGYKVIISHRSGETEDSFIADLAVAVNAGQIKTGSLCRSERLAKYNQLLRIGEQLGDLARYGE